MPKASLDASFCLLAQCEEGKKKTDYWDTTITGFVLEVRPNGSKTYYLRYQDHRRRQRRPGQEQGQGPGCACQRQARRSAAQIGRAQKIAPWRRAGG